MNKITEIKTILKEGESVFKEKGSSFYAYTYPVLSLKEGIEIIKGIKKKYYDATHHCYALKLNDETIKYDDDGEPNATAGIRILRAIEHFGLTNILVVVVRFFGGTKLGVGPLGKAYYEAAFDAINSSEIISKNAYKKVFVSLRYSDVNIIKTILLKYNVKMGKSKFESNAEINFFCKIDVLDNLLYKIKDLTKGNCDIVIEPNELFL